MSGKVVLQSRVRLARNYADLPFGTPERIRDADECVRRTAVALAQSGADAGYELIRLADLDDTARRAMQESRLISRKLLEEPRTAAVLLHRANAVSVMINEEDHVKIQALRPGMDLEGAARECFEVDDALSSQTRFAFDAQLGYLTACPTNTGTGMRATLLLHLPLLTMKRQMGDVGQMVNRVGVNIRGVYGEGSEALGHIYQIGNQVTLGRTEEELTSTVAAVGKQLTDMETRLREKALESDRAALEDSVWRAYGTLSCARLMEQGEFFKEWSHVRLGAAMGVLACDTGLLDRMLTEAQEAHVAQGGEAFGDMREARASHIRKMLGGQDD